MQYRFAVNFGTLSILDVLLPIMGKGPIGPSLSLLVILRLKKDYVVERKEKNTKKTYLYIA